MPIQMLASNNFGAFHMNIATNFPCFSTNSCNEKTRAISGLIYPLENYGLSVISYRVLHSSLNSYNSVG